MLETVQTSSLIVRKQTDLLERSIARMITHVHDQFKATFVGLLTVVTRPPSVPTVAFVKS